MTLSQENFRDDPAVLVSSGWLVRQLGRGDLRLLDASWYLPAAARDAKAEYEAAHIAGALFFDIDLLSDHTSPLPHMVPKEGDFADALGQMGIGPRHQIVVYDGAGIFSAPRVWWLLRLMGFQNVAVLDGGLPKWQAEGRAVTADIPAYPVIDIHLNRQPIISDMAMVHEACLHQSAQILDARPTPRFRGDMPEPRAGLRAGHMPGAKNLPFTELLRGDGTMKPVDQLQAVFDGVGFNPLQPVIASCGSGVTAAIICLALARLGYTSWTLYDGSWAEWGQSEMPIEQGDRHV